MSPLELFLTLVDRTIALVGERKRDKVACFNDVIDPLFQALEPVADDYSTLFKSTQRDVAAGVSAREISLRLSPARDSSERGRVAVKAMAQALRARASDDAIRDFADAVVGYFEGTVEFSSMAMTVSQLVVRLLDEGRIQEASRVVDTMVHQQDAAWRDIARKYANLRLDCLGPSGFVKAH